MQIHKLKTDSDVFRAVYNGVKTFEIRFNDRDFKVGDALVLLETKYTGSEMKNNPMSHPLIYTGNIAVRKVTHILGGPIYGLASGWVIMSIVPHESR